MTVPVSTAVPCASAVAASRSVAKKTTQAAQRPRLLAQRTRAFGVQLAEFTELPPRGLSSGPRLGEVGKSHKRQGTILIKRRMPIGIFFLDQPVAYERHLR